MNRMATGMALVIVCMVILFFIMQMNISSMNVLVVSRRPRKSLGENTNGSVLTTIHPYQLGVLSGTLQSYVGMNLNSQSVIGDQETKQQECFKSPFVICGGNDGERWKLVDSWREKLVDKSKSTAWLPIVKDLNKTDGPAEINTTTTTRNGSASFKKDNVIRIAFKGYNPGSIEPPNIAFDSSNCKYKNCKYIGAQNTEDVDVVVVYAPTLNTNVRLPRWPHQVFVMMTLESPVHSDNLAIGRNEWWNWIFNMTINYRRSSDVFFPYSFLKHEPKPAGQLPDYILQAKNKTKMAIWIVSHCDTSSRREHYVQELKKYIQVDIYGKCGTPCKSSNRSVCDDFSQYLFYLSFENSICDDYVTEKYFKAFRNHIVPVVRGGADYSRLFPPYTFLDAGKLSPKLLAQEMARLSKNLTEYSQYLKNMDEYRVTNSYQGFACQFCKKLNMMDFSKSTFYNMKKWLGKSTHCR